MILKIKYLFCLIATVAFLMPLSAQNQGRFTGAFNSNTNVFLRDSLIGAAGIPQYDNERFGTDAWLDLTYSISGFDLGMRFDIFNNSNLRNPNQSFTDEGIGKWFISKKVNKFGFTVGYIYDQIGTGSIFRAFEARPLFIDNALVGARVTYDISDDWLIKGFAGRQRRIFETSGPTIKGLNLEGFHSIGEKVTIAPGIGFVNRTLDQPAIDELISIFQLYPDEERAKLKYNVYLGSFYNTLSAGPISWYVEAALKSNDVFFDPTATFTDFSGTETIGKFVQSRGSMFYSSLSYANKGLGVTLEGKRTENFNFRVDQTLSQLDGLINYLPPMNRQNTYRLNSRYAPATQDLSEQAIQLDVRYSVNKNISFLVNFSNITDLDTTQLYREIFTEFTYKKGRDWLLKTGIQLQEYNQEIYEVKPDVPNITTVTPYFDFLYRFNRKKSLRTEFQYMNVGADKDTKQDYGDWLFAQLEYTMAPHWAFTVSDMFNISPGKNSPVDTDSGEKLSIHYPRIDIFYTNKANRFGLSYVKQVEGVVCTGGICRLEPAFSGFKFSISSTF